jgi:hypothetical protein
MQTFDQHLADLLTAGEVTFETAMAAATNPSDFELKMRMFRRVASPASPAAPAAAAAPAAGESEPAGAGAGAPPGMDGITQGSGAFDFLGQ